MSIIEEYSRGDITIAQAIRRLGDARAHERRSGGVVYTPPHIVSEMIRQAEISVKDTIWEPSCGHGAFVFPILERMNELLPDWESVKDWFISSMFCSDLSEVTISDLKKLIIAFFDKRGVSLSTDELTNVMAMDSLSPDFRRRFSLAIGNPPYVRTKDMDPQLLFSLRKRFSSMEKGNVDLYYAFIERATDLCDKAVLIVPNSCMSATGAQELRRKCFPRLREVTDFGGTLPFEDARAYVAILRFDDFDGPGRLMFRTGEGKPKEVSWGSLTGEEHHSAPRMAMSGIATLSDKAFIIERDDEGYVSPISGVRVEEGIVRPLVKATKADREMFIIYPYINGKVMSEAYLSETYPEAMKHLEFVRGVLDSRDKGKVDKYPAWFAYGRSQGLHDLSGGAAVIIPAMIGGGSLPRILSAEFTSREPVIVSGFAVMAKDDPERSLLSPEFLSFIRENGKERPGKGGYHSISVKLVNSWLHRRYGSLSE